jgi:arylsulfatase A-like enzyme
MEPRARRQPWPGLIFLACLLSCSSGAPPDARPNFLVVVSDDIRFDALGIVQREQGEAARFPWLETPNLDRLASEGVRFRNAFVVSSLCSPARASFLTGLYGHSVGMLDNETPLDPATPTYASLLRSAGYATGYTGKWHMDEQVERPGFDWSASYKGQGRYVGGSFFVDGSRVQSAGWVDDVSTDFAIEFLRRHRGDPFLLAVGYKAPHVPHLPDSVPERKRGRHAGVELREPENAGARSPYGDNLLRHRELRQRRGRAPRKTDLAPRAIDGVTGTGPGTRVYFDLISAMDDALGRLLDELDALGIADRTFVVFAGDNGYSLGEHGLIAKRAAYEASIRIPLLVRGPARGLEGGRRSDELVLNVDLAPTLLELAGVPAPVRLHGRSLVPLLRGEPTPWRRSFLYEYFRCPGFSAPTQFALRSADEKLIVYPGHPEWTELFDLRADPGEQENLASDPSREEQRRGLHAELLRQARELGLDPAQLGG